MGITAVIGGALIGAGGSAYAANKAASAQKKAAAQASNTQQQFFQEGKNQLAPYSNTGQWFTNALASKGGLDLAGDPYNSPLLKRFNPTIEQLEQTPGYKFVLDQGLKSTQNSYAAKGLGSSGAAMRGAADYAEGLAGTTYQQQFQDYLGQNQQIYNMLQQGSQQGQNAATAIANLAAGTGTQIGQNQVGAGNAAAGAWIGGANAVTGGLNNAGQAFYYNQLLNQQPAIQQAPGFGGTGKP